ncbi:MAG: ATP-dependent Clp protease adaptor ClpS [Bacteroidetes bacterium]|nr:ATP-dependent Clp protease adaptor ClpS [Bacteroidota bacterium]
MTKDCTKPLERTEVLELTRKSTEHAWKLIVWNDDTNTFDWVIQTLMEICGHSREQAEQCALIIHYKGSYAVMEGGHEKLYLHCAQILNRGIQATVESLAHQ